MAGNYVMDWSSSELKPSFSILVGTTDNVSTSLALSGSQTSLYDERFQENLLHIMEHFASDIAPNAPTPGQIWYDTGNNELKLRLKNNIWSTFWYATPPIIVPPPPATVTFTATPTTSVGSPLSLITESFITNQNLAITSQILSTVTLLTGSIPTGTILSSTSNAYIAGTPSVSGNYSGTIRLTHGNVNAIPSFLDIPFYINVSSSGSIFSLMPITTNANPGVFISGTSYSTASSESFIVSANTSISASSLSSGSLPPGMALSNVGNTVRIVGTPTSVGSFTGNISVSQSTIGFSPNSAITSFFINVNASGSPTPPPPPPPPPSDGISDGGSSTDSNDAGGVDAGDAAGGDSGAGGAADSGDAAGGDSGAGGGAADSGDAGGGDSGADGGGSDGGGEGEGF